MPDPLQGSPPAFLSDEALPVETRPTLQTLYEAFNRGRPELLDDVLVADWVDSPLAPGQAPGREGLKPMVAAFRAAFADLHLRAEDMVGSAERVAVRLTLSGRHVREWMGIPATGRPFTVAMHEFHHLRDGRITHTWHVEDWAAWREQVGAAGPRDG